MKEIKKEIEKFIKFVDRLKEKTNKLGTKSEREAFYRKIEKKKLNNTQT